MKLNKHRNKENIYSFRLERKTFMQLFSRSYLINEIVGSFQHKPSHDLKDSTAQLTLVLET